MDQAGPVHLVKCNVLGDALREGLEVYTVPLVVVLQLAKQAVTTPVESSSDRARGVRVVADRLLRRQWKLAESAPHLLLLQELQARGLQL